MPPVAAAQGLPGSAFTWVTTCPLAVLEGGGNADLDAELVIPMSLPLADTFDFRCIPGIDLRPVLTLMLLARTRRANNIKTNDLSA
jgi:hypothetical protein